MKRLGASRRPSSVEGAADDLRRAFSALMAYSTDPDVSRPATSSEPLARLIRNFQAASKS